MTTLPPLKRLLCRRVFWARFRSGRQSLAAYRAQMRAPSDARGLCCIFSLPDADTAAKAHRAHFEIVERYGDACRNWRGKKHRLHAWDAGERMLLRCTRCGALFLAQYSEFHGLEEDACHTDLFPVESREAALACNRVYDGWAMQRKYRGIRLWDSRDGWRWNKPEATG
jgi:hypothetical protein